MLSRSGPVVGLGRPKPMSVAFEPHMGIFVDAQDAYGIHGISCSRLYDVNFIEHYQSFWRLTVVLKVGHP